MGVLEDALGFIRAALAKFKTRGKTMKKILLASSALIATAGVAAAELSIKGSARFGLAYNEGASMKDYKKDSLEINELRIEQRMRVNFTGIAETDSGVKFEARIRLEANESADNSISGKGPGAVGFAVSTGGFRLDVGNVSDVVDSGDAVNYYGYGVGFTGGIEYAAPFYSTDINVGGFGAGGADATTIKAKYSAGDFTIAASYSKNEKFSAGSAATETEPEVPGGQNDSTEIQVGVGYSFGDYTVGLAYVDDEALETGTVDGDYVIATLGGTVGDFGFSVIVGDGDSFTDTAYGVSAKYNISSATNLTFVAADGGNADDATYGIGFSHSLGGGVTLAGGVGSDRGNTEADLGVKFKF
jgi:outer membrane protein OmpU